MKRQFDRVSRLMSIHSHRVLGSLIALALVFTSACGAAQNTSSTCGTSEKTCAPPPAKLSKVSVETIAKGLENPWGMQFLPDGRLLVTERPGRMRIVSKDGKLSEPIAGVPEVAVIGQGGMLDVLLAPDFDTTGTIYFSYGEPREADKNATSVARARLVLNDDGGHLENVKVIFRQEPAMKSKFHFGSRLAWAPDGTLFITTGDRNHLRDEAQNPSNTVGTVVRINSDGTIPDDNPKLEGWAPEVWSIGHRNIQGAAVHPETGQLFTIEHGPRGGDELNLTQKGKNYGWPVITYGINYDGTTITDLKEKEGLEQPFYYWVPSIATSGLAFYDGDLFPEWKGNAFVGGLGGERVERLVFDGDKVIAAEVLLDGRGDRIRDVRQGRDGALWLLTDHKNGEVLRVVPAS